VIYVKTKEYRTLVLLKDKLEGFMKDNRLYQNVAVGFDFNPVNGF
jgi:primosomal protein N' (replication factor Y)